MTAQDEFVIHIDKQQFKTSAASLNGQQLRQLPKPPLGPDRDLYEVVPGPGLHFMIRPSAVAPPRGARVP